MRADEANDRASTQQPGDGRPAWVGSQEALAETPPPERRRKTEEPGLVARPGDVVTVALEQLATLGAACGHYQCVDVFAGGGIVGETARVRVERARPHYLAGWVEDVVSPAPQRVAPACPLFGQCGGCQYQHITYAQQLEIKRWLVAAYLARADLACPPVLPTLPAPNPWRYRNHVRFTVNREGELGFTRRGGRRFLRVDDCLITHPWITQQMCQLQGRCRGIRQVALRYGERTGEYLVHPNLAERGIEVGLASGQPYYHDRLLGASFRVSGPSFFQVHNAQAERLVELVREGLAPQGRETVLDAYAGVGVFAVLLAPLARRAVAIEIGASALADARANAAAAGLDNLDLVEAPVERALPELAAAGTRAEAVVLDPPRAGCCPAVLEGVAALGAERLAYVSCNPATLARDLARLCHLGFRLRSIQPVDMFPQTHHVECVALLER